LHHSGELRAMLQRRDSTLVLATKDKRVRVFSHNMVYQTTFPVNALIYSMLENADGTIWMGSKTDGLFLYTPDSIVNYRADGRACSLLCNDVYDLCYGPDSTLYVATFGGGVNIFRNGKFIHQENRWTGYPERFGSRVRDLLFVDDTTLFAATTTGVLRINTRTLETQATPYFDIRALHQTHDGHLWIGTFGGGLIEVINPLANPLFADENINIYNLTNGLVSDIVLAITEDPSTNDIWFSYEAGLTHLSMDTRTFQHFSALEAEKGAVFGEAHGLMLNDGQLLFGYSFGACRFDPNRIIRVEEVPRIQFTNFLVFNQPLQPTANGPLRDAICYAPRIILNHSQSVFSIEYAALAFPRDDDRVQYAYKMDGVDADWNYVGTLRRATYTRLKRGDFTFRVRSTNTQGVWVDNERTLSIHVCAPVWLTGWAFMLYALLLLLIAFALYETILFVTRLRQEVAVEQKVTEIKLRFFTNISHELRTPLTLITGPVENVLKNEKISPSVRSQLEIVASNSARMLRMINQILDFRKIQNHKMTMKIQQIDISRQVEETCANFNKEAADKHILYSIENDLDETTVWLDKGMLDTIIYNLLSNAFKYTDEGGSITVRLGRRENYVTITVADTGIGIPKDKRSMLFERFASQNEIHAAVNKTGTGIGLNLVKELVDLQHGFIEVESEQGKGSAFTVLFPLGTGHFENDTVEMMVDDTIAASDEQLVAKGIQPKVVSDSRYDILVVDDNEDMCRFLTSFLSPLYSVREAGDGYEALEKIRQQMPDMIISDLMMPNMDGLQLTDRLKNDTSTSHIPIILLTAKSAIESRLEALKYGADDYITKPFSPEYLMTRIENILRQRKNLQETYRSSLLSLQPKQLNEQSPDEIFLAHLLEYMERNMDNSDLTVDDLVREMTLGRTVFFNKLKSLTGLSPVEFIREVRIKRAAQLLEKGHYNVTEITYMVGMNDSRYFAKCFKNAFGVTPTEYKKSLQTDEAGNNAEENEK
jgi:signal transduction histidine kinase/DNA-binding response OmpR family regulator